MERIAPTPALHPRRRPAGAPPRGAQSGRGPEQDLERFYRALAEGESLAHPLLLGLRSRDALELREQVEAGLPYGALERFQRNVALPLAAVAELVQIPARTLTRRRESGRLGVDESDRLVRAARVFGAALELFEGDLDAARTWLATPQPALGGSTPLALARTGVGAREVENLIGRLEHGVFS